MTACVETESAGTGMANAPSGIVPAGTVSLGRPPTPPVYKWGTPEADTVITSPGSESVEQNGDQQSSDETTNDETTNDSLMYAQHIVAFGETLGIIAQQYDLDMEILAEVNNLADTDLIDVGQVLLIPVKADIVGPEFLILPDGELVYGPGVKEFSVESIAADHEGYLLTYEQDIELWTFSGPEIVQLVADRYSVNPRLLLALLEHQSGWLTQSEVEEEEYPLGFDVEGYEGLYMQLARTAGLLNMGFYGRSEGGLDVFTVGGDNLVEFDPEINDGTAGVQLLFGAFPSITYEQWQEEIGPFGIFATYSSLFDDPFDYAEDPLWPAEIEQPPLTLPWTIGETWYFTSGPHAAWAEGSAWAALDFAPPGELFGCVQSESWVTAMADGLVTRSYAGAVVVDLDGDDYAGTGWTILYMHLESRDRVEEGATVKTGDRLGHPSCEGGYSNGTHLHLARTYNGRWVSADTVTPFIMSGWVSQGFGFEYDGLLVRGDESKEACECREELNSITAD
jgi:murein DD-endopeptidase MepM/ murein hydrolase activator NlpD